MVKPLPRYGKAINAAVLLAFVMLVVAGAVALTMHNKPTPITTSSTRSTDGNSCLLSSTGCPVGDNSSTPTPTTQTPAKTQSTPATTSTPTPNSSTYSNCYDETVHYAAVQEDVTWVQTGQTMSLPGVNGTDRICNGVVTVLSRPTNAIDYIGTGNNLEPSSITPTQPNLEPYQNTTSSNSSGLTESQAAQQCDNNLANGADASNPQAYFVSCMNQYGY